MGERRRDKKQLKATREQTRLQNEWAMQQQAMHAQQMAVLQAQNQALRQQAQQVPPPPHGPVGAPPSSGGTPEGWYRDPSGRFAERWYSGSAWSEHVRSANGAPGVDPVPQPRGDAQPPPT